MAHSGNRRRRDKSSSRSRSRSRSSRSSSSSSSPSSSSTPSSSSASSRSTSSSSATSSRSSRSDTSRVSTRRRSPSPICRVQVNRLTKNINKSHLLEIFKTYGPIKSIDLPMDRHHPHLGRGTATIEFEKSEDTDKAIRYMDGGQIDGQEIAVSKTNRSSKPAPRQRATGSHRNGSWRRNSPRR